ncbi:hypothetical protein JCM10207_007627 [Rhodosporidiobolus poonsookiae]
MLMSPYTASGEQERPYSAGGLLSTAPAARTIYSYSAPSSPYPAYPRSRTQSYEGAQVYPATTPCSCPDCVAPAYAMNDATYYTEPFPSTSNYAALPYPPAALYSKAPAEQPVFRPVAQRPPVPYYASAPPQPSPPLVDQLPVPDPLYSQPAWRPSTAPSPPALQPPFSERDQPLYDYYPPPPQQTSSQLLSPFVPATPLDRRRSSSGVSFFGEQRVITRRASSFQLGGSPRSETSYGSDEADDRHDHTVTPFMHKLHFLLNNPEYSDVIRWNAAGTAFVFAHSTEKLATAFGKVFRHSNSHSFTRQLNLYTMKRLSSMELHAAVESVPHPQSDLTSADFAGFSHPLFFRDSPDRVCDLSRIKPKAPPKKKSMQNLAAAGKLGNGPPPRTRTLRSLRSDSKIGGGMQGRKL